MTVTTKKRGLVALIALTALAGCGKSATPATKSAAGVAALLAASETTQKAGSSKMSLAVDFTAGSESFAMSGDGAFDYAKQAGEMTFKMSGDEIPEAFTGYEMLFMKGIVYMKFPASFAQIAPGLKPWIKIDTAELAKQQGLNLPGFNSFANQDPSSTLAFTKGAENVTAVGSEDVRGETTTHYSMTVDLGKAIAGLTGAEKSGLEAMVDKLGVTTLPMNAWIDGAGRVRRIQFTMDLSKFGDATGASTVPSGSAMRMTLDLFAFGTPVHVAAPPAGQVSDFSELSKLSGSS